MDYREIISDWFRKYSDDVYNFLIYRIGTGEVEDLLQEVFIKALKSYDSFKGDASPKTWLYKIARNLALDEFRKKKRLKWKILIPFESKYEPKDSLTPEDILQLNEKNKELYQSIQLLKDNYKEVIILRGIEGLSVAETATILKWSEKKVTDTYYLAKKALQKQLGGGRVE